ncbi:MAG TPA: NYN domain-containing protein [Terriglobia bacterium]|nr:NYN domain-containing protein [Terriglobia bacterium]
MAEERLKIAVFVDFDNIQIGVKDTLGKDFDVSIVLEALKERGEVVSKVAYGDWPRASEYSRQMTQHAIHMVQRSVTPRGDKNGADINLALDALEMAFTHNHINTFVIVGGDSDFIALVEKLKQYDKRVFVVGGRQFTSGILQRNCHEFISYENLLKTGGDTARAARTQRTAARSAEGRSLSTAMPNIQRALEILAEREVAPQLGLLKSTLLQLDATFSERDFGAGSFLEFIQKLRKAGLVEMRRTDRGYLVEALEGEGARETSPEPPAETAAVEPEPVAAEAPASEAPAAASAPPAPEAIAPVPPPASPEDSLAVLRQGLPSHFEKAPNRPLYLRQIRQLLRATGSSIDERSGFRGLLDLLHQAQREGWLRLHRDRKGVWRVFPAGPAPAAVPATQAEVEIAVEAPTELEPGLEPGLGSELGPEMEPEVDPDLLMPVETDVNWEVEAITEEVSEPAEPPSPPEPPPPAVIEEVVPVEPTPQPKPRKPRATKGGAKGGKRKTAPRRKTKEPAEPSEG